MGVTYNAGVVRSGLVLYLDAANIKSYPGSGTTWTDLSGLGNHGTLQNGPVFSSNNRGSFAFDAADDTVWIPNSTALDNQNQTVVVWTRTNALSQNGFWFEKGAVNSQYALFQEGVYIVWRHRFTDTALVSQYTTSAACMNTSQYCMVAGTYDSVNKITWINGVPVTTTAETRTVSVNSTGMRVGSYVSGGYFFNGNIAQVMVYNRALSQLELIKNFNASRGRYGL